MSEIPLFVVDAFVGNLAARSLRGNAAAVVFLDAPQGANWMQEVAAEMNFSETAFLTAQDAANSASDFGLRWFTPVSEVNLCGHATLASAHFLWESGRVSRDQNLRFHTLSGVLGAKSEAGWIWLDFPAQTSKSVAAPQGLAAALGFSPREPVAIFKVGDDLLVNVPRGCVEPLRPDFAWLGQISAQLKVRGIIVTSEAGAKNDAPARETDFKADCEADFVSRFFAPAIGIPEDPVTGSAHAALAPFWGAQLQKTAMTGYQASPRGGLVRVVWRESRVDLGGKCATFLRGILNQLEEESRFQPATISAK